MQKEDIDCVNRIQPDYCGFIVNFPKSHRSKTEEEVKNLTSGLSDRIVSVGVFVDEDPRTVIRMLREKTIDTAQLHGNENEDYIRMVQRESRRPAIRAFEIQTKEDVRKAERSPADAILLDAGKGSGRSFNWSLLNGIQRDFFLAGGLSPENLRQALQQVRPAAVDLSSGVETAGRKDAAKMEEAVRIVRQFSDG